MNLQEILDQSPDIPGYGGGKWAMYSVNCCWWTSFPEDLGALPPVTYDHKSSRIKPNPGGPSLPCCPHCHSVLMQAPLEKFVEYAQGKPGHYGQLGMQIFVASHHRNSPRCFTRWEDYEIFIENIQGVIMIKKVLRIRHYKAGYEVRTELIDGQEFSCPDFEIKSAYTPEGLYIGDPKMAHQLCKKRGIKPEYRTPASNVCTIGFSQKEGKWFGWSHRAIWGFKVGDVVKEGDVTAEYLPIGFKAETIEQAKQMAEAFSESVS